MSNFKVWHIVLFCYFLITNKIFYNIVSNNYDLTEKQKSYILSFKNAVVLSVLSLFFNYYFFKFNKFLPELSEATLIYFTSYLVSDLVIGRLEYPGKLSLLEGYIHHSAYTAINTYSLHTVYTPAYLLFLVAEIPTALLGYYNLFYKPKNKQLYSNLFLLFRIIAIVVLLFFTSEYKNIRYFALPILMLHLYWYKKSIKSDSTKEQKEQKEQKKNKKLVIS